MDKNKINAFWQARTTLVDSHIATCFRHDGRSAIDIAFVAKHLPADARILDLGAGTCALIAPFLDDAKEIVAVDKFAEFLDRAPDHPRLKKICADVVMYSRAEAFDTVLLFGVVNFLTADEENALYRRVCANAVPEGCFASEEPVWCRVRSDR